MSTKDITPAGKLVILHAVAAAPTKPDGAPVHGTYKNIAARHGISAVSVSKLWHRHGTHSRAALDAHELDHQALLARLQPKRAKRCGRKSRPLLPLQTLVASLKPEAKMTYRSTAFNTGVPATSLHRYVKCGLLKCASDSIKLRLTDQAKTHRGAQEK